jgi:transposase InsO family protein
MGVTIQFESHRVELARIHELEHDPDVLEYYDQPPSFELIYQSKNGRRLRHPYTADFFVIRQNSAGWEECKTEEDLEKLTKKNPNRYHRDEDGIWRCPPVEAYAHLLGLNSRVWSNAEIDWTFQNNFNWLSDYLHADSLTVDTAAGDAISALVQANEGITLWELLRQAESIDADDIYALIATNEIYIDLTAERLANNDKVEVFSSEETALAYKRAADISHASTSKNQPITIAVGHSLAWDGECWEILNTGANSTTLSRSDGKVIDLPNEAFDKYIQDGKISALTPSEGSNRKEELQEILRAASPDEIAEANRRYDAIQPYLGLDTPPTPTSTIRRWRIAYRKAEELFGSGYIGLLPKHHAKGNRLAKMDESVRSFMENFIKENYETTKQRRGWRVYNSFVVACKAHDPPLSPPSSKAFYDAIKRRSGRQQTEKREGRRAGLQKRPTYYELELTTPRHGDRPFEIVHIDHTQLDIELVSSLASLSQCNVVLSGSDRGNLGRPWASFMVDAYSRRLLAVYITYEEPSYRSCMAVLRICVQRYKRFPQSIVVDNGSEFHSHYFEQLLAFYNCTKKHRPPADARFGNVIERLFGTANTQFVHELCGNTQILRKYRQVTKSVRPEHHAEWTLGAFNEALCEWAYEIYDQRQHPALGQSPHEAFNNGLAMGGSRSHRRVEYDETFRMLTLPAPERGGRIVQPGQGIKLHHIYYWSNAFRSPEIEKSKVAVRYEPFNISIAYAYVNSSWVQCISAHHHYLKGRSEKEMRLIITEVQKRLRDQGINRVLREKDIVDFLKSQEVREEKFIKIRLQVCENMSAQQEYKQSRLEHQDVYEITTIETPSTLIQSQANITSYQDDSEPVEIDEDLEFYGEW